jgi:hypothetical protein
MSFNFSPKVVTDGLVLYLDAANTKSYTSGSTTWNDMSRGGNNGTLVNGPTFSSTNGGCMVFDGIDDFVSIPNPLNQSNLLQEWSVSAWINITTKTRQCLLGNFNTNLYVSYFDSSQSLLYLNQGVDDYYTYGGNLSNIGWVLATFRFKNSTGQRTIYRNGTNISTTGPNFTSTPKGIQSTLTIGYNIANAAAGFQGSLSNIMIYNRYITDQEILQNYNATKSRFI